MLVKKMKQSLISILLCTGLVPVSIADSSKLMIESPNCPDIKSLSRTPIFPLRIVPVHIENAWYPVGLGNYSKTMSAIHESVDSRKQDGSWKFKQTSDINGVFCEYWSDDIDQPVIDIQWLRFHHA